MDLDDLEKLAGAATPGEWSEIPRCSWAESDRACGVVSSALHKNGRDRIQIFASDAYDECGHPVSAADAAFIAAANPATVLKLCAVVRAVEDWSKLRHRSAADDDKLYRALAALKDG